MRLTSLQTFRRLFAKRAPEAGTGATAHKPDTDSNYEEDIDDDRDEDDNDYNDDDDDDAGNDDKSSPSSVEKDRNIYENMTCTDDI